MCVDHLVIQLLCVLFYIGARSFGMCEGVFDACAQQAFGLVPHLVRQAAPGCDPAQRQRQRRPVFPQLP